MHQTAMLLGLKFHVFNPYSDAFPRFWGSFAQNRISLSRPNLEGNVWYDGHLVAESGENKGPVCRKHHRRMTQTQPLIHLNPQEAATTQGRESVR